MTHKWTKTKYPGIRYRNHPTRKHGAVPDKYFNIRFQVDGRTANEGYGWASEGMTASKAALLMAELKEELRTGKGTGKLTDRRKAQRSIEEQKILAEQKEYRLKVTYKQFWTECYCNQLQLKKATTASREEQLNRLWIQPVIGNRLIHALTEFDLQRVIKTMNAKGKSERTQHYALQAIRMVINHALKTGHFEGVNPVTTIKQPRYDNRRVRFLSPTEAKLLLTAVKKRSQTVHGIALLSLLCGLRLGEIYNLTWSDIDLENGLITIKDSKSGRNRAAYMTESVRKTLQSITKIKGCPFVFPVSTTRRGRDKSDISYQRKQRNISKSFTNAIDELGLNSGIDDRRQKATFHTLRHTFASWHVQRGTSLYEVQRLLGHSSISMTERYSHLSPDRFRAAAETIENMFNEENHTEKVSDTVA